MQLAKHWAAQLDDYVIDLAWSPDGARLAAASAAGPVALHSVNAGARQYLLPGHDNGTNVLAWAPTTGAAATDPPVASWLATGGQDGTVKFWDPSVGQHTSTAAIGSAWVEHLVWWTVPLAGASGRRAVVAAAAGRRLALCQPDGVVVRPFPSTAKTILALAVRPGDGVMAAAWFGGISLWRAVDFQAGWEFAYGNGIQALVWSPDGRWLVSGNQDPSVHLWIPETGVELHMSGYAGKVKCLSFDRASRWLATSGSAEVCVWDCSGEGPEGREPLMLPHEAPVCVLAFQYGHGLLASGAQDGVVRIWSPERPEPLCATVKLPVAPTRLAWSPEDRYLAIGTERGALYVLRCAE